MRGRRWGCVAFALAFVPLAAVVHAQVLDRIVAIVGEQVITLSDARATVELKLLPDELLTPNPTGDQGAAARTPRPPDLPLVVARLVDRELMRAEIERFGVTAPPPELLAARAAAIEKRFGSKAAFAAALDAAGLSEARFRAWIGDDWRIEQYIQQRFEAAAQPTDEDVLQYYQSREREFAVNDRPRPFNDVRDAVRTRLLASRRQALVDEWVAGLRRRADIVMLIGREGV